MSKASAATTASRRGSTYFALPKLISGGPILFALVFVVNVTASKAQVIASADLVAGRNAYSEAGADVHNALRVSARVFSLQRQGSDNTYPRRKIKIELINPAGQAVTSLTAGIGHDGNQTVNGRDGTSRGNGYELKAPAALGGSNACSRWRVKLTDAETGAAPNPDPSSQRVSGSIEFFATSNSSSSVSIQAPPKFGVVQSDTVEKTITVPFTGEIIVQANWDTDEFTLDNYQLKFSLINTQGNVVVSDSGYSRDSFIIGISDSQRMKLDYVTKCADFGGPQPWKIRVRGASQGKVKNVDLKASLSPPFYLDAVTATYGP